MMELKRNDFVVGFLIMTVVFGLMYQGFNSLSSFDALSHYQDVG